MLVDLSTFSGGGDTKEEAPASSGSTVAQPMRKSRPELLHLIPDLRNHPLSRPFQSFQYAKKNRINKMFFKNIIIILPHCFAPETDRIFLILTR